MIKKHTRFSFAYAFWLLALLILARLLLPREQSDYILVLENICHALDDGLNWGRQCLAGSIRYPLLPALWTWLVIHADPGREIMAALPAFGCLQFLLRWHFAHRPAGIFSKSDSAMLGIALLFFCYCCSSGMDLGPEAFLLTGFLFYMLRYFEDENLLGDLVMAAFCLGLLAFCGFLSLLCAAFLLLELKAVPAFLKNARQGIYLNLSLPFCYGVFLLLILNWQIMENPLFFFHEAFLWASGCTWGDFQQGGEDVFRMLALNLPGLIFPGLCLLQRDHQCRRAGRLLLLVCGLVILREMLRTVLGFQPDQMGGLCILLEFWGAAIFLLQTLKRTLPLQYAAAAVILLLIFLFHYKMEFPVSSSARHSVECRATFPYQNELEQYVDHSWKDARIIILGDRMPASLLEGTGRKYLPRLDFQQWEILKQAGREQLFILLPPPEAGYYPKGRNSPLAKIYERGAQWLLLEKQWPDGWQLLRVVTAPAGKSRLDDFLE